MNFYKELEHIIEECDVRAKLAHFFHFYKAYKNGTTAFEEQYEKKVFLTPSYSKTCTIISPQDVPKRSNLSSAQGQINLLHAIAHIEFSAIDLALDAAYRFSDMPLAFYDDWLSVASDEVRHFLMLQELLEELDASYGDLPVHNALFEALQKTQTLTDRMAVVPRYLEANGLDATPMILEKLYKLPKSQMLEKIITALETILDEEIDHVKKGDFWFNYACKEENLSNAVYFQIIQKYYPQGFLRPKNLNIQARKEAGFSCSELEFMAKKELC